MGKLTQCSIRVIIWKCQFSIPSLYRNITLLFLFHYIEFQAPQNCSSPQPCTEKRCFILRFKTDVLPFKIQWCIHNSLVWPALLGNSKKLEYKLIKLLNLASIPWLTTCGLIPCKSHSVKYIFHENFHWCHLPCMGKINTQKTLKKLSFMQNKKVI